MTNFMVNDNLEYTFHPRLNIVIGPNGSGKSTLVCAIYLGLNGDVKKLGRGGSLVEYINMARPTRDATITIIMCEISKFLHSKTHTDYYFRKRQKGRNNHSQKMDIPGPQHLVPEQIYRERG